LVHPQVVDLDVRVPPPQPQPDVREETVPAYDVALLPEQPQPPVVALAPEQPQPPVADVPQPQLAAEPPSGVIGRACCSR
jgi:hypothetical protein